MVPNHLPQPTYRPYCLKDETVIVTEDFEFPLFLAGEEWRPEGCLLIRRGFVFDGGSIPRWGWTVCNVTPFTPSWIAAFAGHDASTGGELLPFKKCDKLLHDMGKAYGNTRYQYEMIYYHVWMWGWTVYHKHTDKSVDQCRRYVEILKP